MNVVETEYPVTNQYEICFCSQEGVALAQCGSTLDYRSTSRAIDPAHEAWFRANIHLISPGYLRPVCSAV